MVKIKVRIPGLEPYRATSYMEDEAYKIFSAREFLKENPSTTAAQCLAAGRAALKAAQAEMTPDDVAKDKEMQAERDRKQIAKIAEAEAKKPETAKEKEERTREEVPPAEMDDAQFMRWQFEQLHKGHPEYDTTRLIREARQATFKTAKEREKNRKAMPAARRAKAAARTQPVTIPTDRALTSEELVSLASALEDLHFLHPDWTKAELLTELQAPKKQ